MGKIETNMETKHEEAIEFQGKMDQLIENGVAKDYTDAGLLAELDEDIKSDHAQAKDKIKRIGRDLMSGSPMDEIFTRNAMVREVAEKMKDGHKSIMIEGIWRTGNSSMMEGLVKEMGLEKNTIRISLACADFQLDNMTWQAFLEDQDLSYYVCKMIAEKEDRERAAISEEIEKSGMQPLEYLDEYLSKKEDSQTVLLQVDEATALTGRDDYEKYLEELNHFGEFKNIRVVLNMHRIGNKKDIIEEKLSNFEPVALDALSFEDSKRIVKLMLPDVYTTISSDDLHEIYSTTGGRPYEIVYLCYFLKKYSKEEKSLKPLIEKIPQLSDWREYFNDLTYNRIEKFAFSDKERDLVRNILEKDGVLIGEDGGLGEDLLKYGLLKKEKRGDKEVYLVNGTALEEYLKEKMLNNNTK